MRIVATGKYLPPKIVTNAELEKIVETTDEWIVTRTGIKERRIASEAESSSEMGARAAQEALRKAGIAASEIDLILVASVTADATFPSTACYVQHKIGAGKCAAVDIQAACSGFVYALVVGSQFLATGAYKNILVVGCERLSSIVDWTDRSTCVLFGDGAGAAVIQPRADGKNGLLAFDLGANGGLHEILYLMNGQTPGPEGLDAKAGPHYMKMSGQEVFKQAVTEMGRSANKALETAGLTVADLACVIPHQANIRIIEALRDRLQVPPEKCFINVQRYGNISAACIPVGLDEAAAEFSLQRGDKILLVAFGGGLTWASCVLEW
ncbi:MAG: beta-ketoacyl-ACP synthase III [Candidatus Methylacidiphilales bacterium]|nr:beta-ketoacyl-ACP synthase III [Candidatus Methylacidiphilales bacterium]